MKKISISRANQSFSLANIKLFLGNGKTIAIRNGETKYVELDKLPVKVFAKQGWVKSKMVTIDDSTTGLILKNEKIKNIIAPLIGSLLLLTLLLPRTIWGESTLTNFFGIGGLVVIIAWTVYAFFIKRDNWILIDKSSN